MLDIELVIDRTTYDLLQTHLAADKFGCEEAAFLFCREQRSVSTISLTPVEVSLLTADAFASRSPLYLELTDETRASLIKRAHDLGSCLVEVHSHPGQETAEFSWSDLSGFQEFVPHVRWRLKGRPYVAVVCSSNDFDALAWQGDSHEVAGLSGIRVDDQVLTPTGKTLTELRASNER